MRLSEELAFIPLYEPKDAAGTAFVSDAFNAGLLDSVSLFLSFGVITGDATVLTVNGDLTSALATALTTPIAFKYRLATAAFKTAPAAAGANADQFGDPISVAAAGLTLVSATFAHKTIVIEIDPDTLVSKASWITLNTTASASPLLMAGFGIGRSRYAGHLIPSAL
jgi:hypothetical protein